MLVSDILDRTFSEWLAPAGVDRPAFDLLAGDMTATIPPAGSTFEVLGHLKGSIPPDSLLEIDSELVLTRDVAQTTVTVQDRGWLDTAPAAHTAGAKVYLNPKYPRLTLLHALASVIGNLWPWGLYVKAIDTSKTFTTRTTISLPAGGRTILSILVNSGGQFERYHELKMRGRDWIEYHQFNPTRFTLLRGGGQGLPMIIAYKQDFARPTSEAQNLDDLSIPVTLQPYLPLAIAGYVLQSKEIPRVQVEEIRRMLSTTGIQVGQVMNIGQQMLRTFRGEYVAAERRRLRQDDPTQIEWASA